MLKSLRTTPSRKAETADDDAVWELGMAAARAIQTRAWNKAVLVTAAHHMLSQARVLRAAGVIPLQAGDLFADAGWVERNIEILIKDGLIEPRAAALCTSHLIVAFPPQRIH